MSKPGLINHPVLIDTSERLLPRAEGHSNQIEINIKDELSSVTSRRDAQKLSSYSAPVQTSGIIRLLRTRSEETTKSLFPETYSA